MKLWSVTPIFIGLFEPGLVYFAFQQVFRAGRGMIIRMLNPVWSAFGARAFHAPE
jgi:hypothetical protein